MYVALRGFKNKLPTGETVSLRPGDEVQGFAAWPIVNQLAAIDAKLVRQLSGDVPSVDGAAGLAHRETSAQRQERRNALIGQAQKPAAAPVAAEAQAEPPQADPQPADDAPGANVCPQCGFSASSPHALKIHVGRIHKAAR